MSLVQLFITLKRLERELIEALEHADYGLDKSGTKNGSDD